MKPNPGDGLLLHRHIPPLTRRYMAYFCSGAHIWGSKSGGLHGRLRTHCHHAGSSGQLRATREGFHQEATKQLRCTPVMPTGSQRWRRHSPVEPWCYPLTKSRASKASGDNGRDNKKPCIPSQPSSRRTVIWSSFSTPFAITCIFKLWPIEMTAFTME